MKSKHIIYLFSIALILLVQNKGIGIAQAVEAQDVVEPKVLPIAELDLVQSVDEAIWSPLTGGLWTGFTMELDPAEDFHYLDVDNVATNRPLDMGLHPFYLDTHPDPEIFFAYWDSRGVNADADPGSWQEAMWQIINKALPIFYLKVSDDGMGGQTFMLVDGLQFALFLSDEYHLRVDGDYLAGYYTYNGDIEDHLGNVNSYTVSIFFTDETTSYQHLPIIINGHPGPPPIFGVETHQLQYNAILDKAEAANVYWVRNYAVSWEDIEPERYDPPDYNWDAIDESALQEASARGLELIITVKFTPYWAQKYAGYSCGPIDNTPLPLNPNETALDAFAQFMGELVERYSVPPYNIHHWELGNEPDVDPYDVGWEEGHEYNYGCWGDVTDPNYGGGYYAEMLKHVYPEVKSVDPQAQILIGGLLLDCYPTDPLDNTCINGKFFDGILLNQGADYFDVVSFHAFGYWVHWEPDKVILDEQHPHWGPRGGLVLGKVDFLREVMESHNVDKPIIQSESALLCIGGPPCPDPDFYEAQADYVVWVYVRNLAANILGTTWYTLEGPGWRDCGLLSGSTERPAYQAYKFITQELGEAEFVEQLTQQYPDHPNLRVYEFASTWKNIWVLWTSNHSDTDPPITLPSNTLHVYDKYGTDITPASDQIVVNNPIYVEFLP